MRRYIVLVALILTGAAYWLMRRRAHTSVEQAVADELIARVLREESVADLVEQLVSSVEARDYTNNRRQIRFVFSLGEQFVWLIFSPKGV